jgi:hypothetical protein
MEKHMTFPGVQALLSAEREDQKKSHDEKNEAESELIEVC